MEKIIDWVPRAVAALVGIAVAAWGALVSWDLAFGSSGSLIAGLGMLLLATPVLALLAAAVNFWFIDLLLTPVRSLAAGRSG